MTPVTSTINRLLAASASQKWRDADLLAHYVNNGDEAAFAELSRRYGRMVLSIARREVRDRQLAEDVLQAVFMVLANKAGKLAHPDRLAGWLFGVAHRIARKAAARRCRDIRLFHPLITNEYQPRQSPELREMFNLLDEEMARLPEAERVPLVLCYLEGLTQEEAARLSG